VIQNVAAEVARLRHQAMECRLLARMMSLKEDAKRLLAMAQDYDVRAQAVECAARTREVARAA
jgi:hypothetical protein